MEIESSSGAGAGGGTGAVGSQAQAQAIYVAVPSGCPKAAASFAHYGELSKQWHRVTACAACQRPRPREQ